MRLNALRCAVALCAVFLSIAPRAVRAGDHLPLIDIQPVSSFAAAGDARQIPGDKFVNGQIDIAGTVTVPIFKGFSASYDRIVNGVYHQTYDRVTFPVAVGIFPHGNYQPGSYRDMVEQFRFDEQYRNFTLEGGSAFRHRMCCPGSSDPNNLASTEWHQLYLGLTYTTHPIDFLHNSVFVLNITGHSANHNPSPNVLAFEQLLSPGIVDINKHEYGTSQAATLVVPVDAKHGFTATGTFTWGAFDYLENYPYPLTYDIWVFTANKRFSKFFGIELREANVWQRPGQNTPFPFNVQHVAEWSAIANFHIDLNHL